MRRMLRGSPVNQSASSSPKPAFNLTFSVSPTTIMASQDLFAQLDSYNWDADQEYQLGLQRILQTAGPNAPIDDLTLKSKIFYFARKFGQAADYDKYKAHCSSKAQSEQDPTSSLTYAELVDYIKNGKTVPGIKDIPDTVLTGQGTQSIAAKRKKPWEKTDERHLEQTAIS
jgi:Family of unknown function (DUF5572)